MGKRNKQQMKSAVAAATATKNNKKNENDVGKYCSFCYLLKKENNKHYLWLVNKNKNLKTILIGFFFGIFLGPVHLANGSFIMNIANLFFGDGQDSLFLAFTYASGYALISFIIYFTLNNRAQKK